MPTKVEDTIRSEGLRLQGKFFANARHGKSQYIGVGGIKQRSQRRNHDHSYHGTGYWRLVDCMSDDSESQFLNVPRSVSADPYATSLYLQELRMF